MFKQLLSKLIAIGVSIFSTYANSAACCGSSFAAPSIITSEDKAQIAYSYNWSKIHADVNTKSQWSKRHDNDITQTQKIEAAHILADRWQIGGTLTFIKRKNDSTIDNKSSGLGDSNIQLGFEYLPDWDYNPYRPKGIGYLMMIIPTGNSIYESDTASGIDARGKGFWGLGIGTVFIKSWDDWDASLNLEAHEYASKNISNSNTEAKIKPGAGFSTSIGAGRNWNKFRIGAQIQWLYEGATKVSGTTTSEGELKRNTTGTILLSYALNMNQSLVANYSDQTILADPYNTSLSKSIGIFYQWRFER